MSSARLDTSREGLKKLIADDPAKAAKIIEQVRKGRIELARENPSFFCEYVLRNESDGTAITQETPHEDIQQLFLDHKRVVVWTHPGLGKCLAGNEWVTMADGTQKRVKDITTRSHILTFDPLELSYKVVEAGPSVPDARTHILRVELTNGMVLRATANHPVYVEHQGWTPLGVLQLGQRILTLANDPAPHKDVQPLAHHEAWLAGLLFTAVTPGYMAETYRRDNPASPLSGNYLTKNCPRGAVLRYLPDALTMRIVNKTLERFGLVTKVMGELLAIYADPKSPNYTKSPREWARSLGVRREKERLYVPLKVQRSDAPTIRQFFYGLMVGADARVTPGLTQYQPETVRIAELVGASSVVRPLRKLAVEAGLNLAITSAPNRMKRVEHRGRWDAKRYATQQVLHTPQYPEDVYVTILDAATRSRIWPTKTEPAEQEAVRFVPVLDIIKERALVQTYALPVHDPCHSHVTDGGIISHNTNQISIGRTLWLLGNDPNKTVLIVSNTREAATRIIGALKRYIEDSPELHEVFPHLKPGRRWSESLFEVHRSVIRKTPSVVAVGLHGSIMGMRADEIILDDVDGPDSVSTPHAKAQAMTWIERSALSRLNPDGGRIGAIGNVWAEDDILHKLSRKSGYHSQKFPVVNDEGDPLLPGRFPQDVIDQIKIDQGPLRFAQIYMCQARDESTALFKNDWLEECCAAGEGKSLMQSLPAAFPSALVFTGVDLGVRQSKGSDPTVIVTCLLHPDKRRQVVSVKYGLWSAKEIADNIADQYAAFGGTVLVENNGAQQFLIDILSHSHTSKIPVVGFETTGKKKHDPVYGVESIANEMASGQWIFPSSDGTIDGAEPSMRFLLDAMCAYQRGKHTPDGLMALWICREGMRLDPAKRSKVSVGRLRLRPR